MNYRITSSFILRIAVLFLGCLLIRTGSSLADDHHVSSKTVKQVQSELKEKGYYDGDVDGVLGAQTRAGLRRYQKEKGLEGDGRLTHDTAIHLGVAAKDNPTPGEHFEDAGAEIKEHYGDGGKALGKGADRKSVV